MFKLTVEIASNPDRDSTDWSETHAFSAPTMAELRKKINAFQADNNIGGGNWGEATLHQDDTLLGYMSYNGRIWKNKYWEKNSFEEVILPNDEF